MVVLVCYPCASAVSTGHVLSLFPPAAMLCLPFDGSRLILESYFLFLGGRCHSWIRGRNPLLGHSPRIGPIVSAVRFGSRRSLLLFAPSDRLLHIRVFPACVSLTIHFDPVLRLVWSCDFSASVIALPQGCYRCPCCWFSLHRCSLLDSGAAGGGAVTACYRPWICFSGLALARCLVSPVSRVLARPPL